MWIEAWTLAIAVVTAVSCALCGGLLLVARKSMVSEGLSHAVLPGLVIAFVLTRDYNSPWLILAAAGSGMLMVWLTQIVQRSGLVDDDAGLGIVFAGMFSLGILIVSLNLRNTHFHADCIIDGNLALAALDRLEIGGFDLGPRSWVVMCVVLALVVGFIVIAYKELKLGIFDPILAQRFGFRPALLQSIWLGVVSITTVAAFDVAGSILIVALMIAPPAAAYLLTDRLGWLLATAAFIAIVSAIGGFYLAVALDVAPAGPIASFAGLNFLLVFAFSPDRGCFAAFLRRARQRAATRELLVLEFIAQSGRSSLREIAVPQQQLARIVSRLTQSGMIREHGEDLELTEPGQARLQQAFADNFAGPITNKSVQLKET